jgi:broad specificity phosphatase PhoE
MIVTFPHRLYFIRHGETDWNVAGRLQGQLDTPLNDHGRAQAVQAAHTFAKLGRKAGSKSDALIFVSSPLRRCIETMQLARGTLGLPIDDFRRDARLVELSFGEWEGLTWPQIRATVPDAAVIRDRALWSFAAPGGESYEAMARRIAASLAEIEGDAVLVGHGGVGRLLMLMIGGVPRERALTATVPQGRVLVLDHGSSRWV